MFLCRVLAFFGHVFYCLVCVFAWCASLGCWGVLGGQVETENGVEHHNWLAIPVGVLALLGGQ